VFEQLLEEVVARCLEVGLKIRHCFCWHDSHRTAACTDAHRGNRRSSCVARVAGVFAAVIAPPANTRIWIAAGVTDPRRGFMGLSALVQTKLEQSPMSGHVFVFRGRRGDLIRLLWFDGDGLCYFPKDLSAVVSSGRK
jgi:transposase